MTLGDKMNNNYINVSSKWLRKAKPNSHKIEDAKYVVKNNKRYYINNENKINHMNNKVEVAMWLESTFGGVLKYLPDINEDNVKCADYYFRKAHWNLVEIKDSNLYDSIEQEKERANNFIIDVSRSKLNDKEIYQQIDRIFSYAKWVDTIIVKRNYLLVGVFKNKGDLEI